MVAETRGPCRWAYFGDAAGEGAGFAGVVTAFAGVVTGFAAVVAAFAAETAGEAAGATDSIGVPPMGAMPAAVVDIIGVADATGVASSMTDVVLLPGLGVQDRNSDVKMNSIAEPVVR